MTLYTQLASRHIDEENCFRGVTPSWLTTRSIHVILRVAVISCAGCKCGFACEQHLLAEYCDDHTYPCPTATKGTHSCQRGDKPV